MKKRNLKISVLATLGCFAIAGGALALSPATANAASEDITFETGASIRVSEPSGIRFTANFNKAFAEESLLTNDGAIVLKDSVEIGMVITPSWVLQSVPQNADVIDYLSTKYNKEKADFTTEFSASQIKLTDAGYTVNGAIVKIQDANYSSEYQAVAYYSLDDGANYVYSAYSDERNIATVAEAALENEEWLATWKEQIPEIETTLNAIVEKAVYDVTYVADGETFYTEKVGHGKTVAYEETPTGENKVFVGWFEDAELSVPFDSTKAIKTATTLYASFSEPTFVADVKNAYIQYGYAEIPEGKFTFDGQIYNATATVIDPDGQVVEATANGVQLKKLGAYTVSYTATINGSACTATKTLNSVETVGYAIPSSSATTIETNADIPGGWGNGMLAVNIAAGDTVTLSEVVDFTGKTLSSNYFAAHISFHRTTQAGYNGKDLTIRYTNPDDSTDYAEFYYTCNVAVSTQVYVRASYSKGSSNTWGMSYFGSDIGSAYSDRMFVCKLGTDGLGATWYSTNVTRPESLPFSKAIVTMSSASGISVGFSYVADARGWQTAIHKVTYTANGQIVNAENVVNGGTAKMAITPASAGAEFLGWFASEADAITGDVTKAITTATAITSDMNLYAGFAKAAVTIKAPLLVEYAQNSEFTVPQATVSFKGESVDGTLSSVKAPDGSVVTVTDGKFTLAYVGEYTLVYAGTVGGAVRTAEKTIKVAESPAYVSASSANTVTSINPTNKYIFMNIQAGDTVTLNKIVSWKDLTANGNELFFAYFTDGNGASYTGKEMTVTVTNANDSSEWISFRTYMYPSNGLNQITCGITTSSGYSNNWWMSKYAGSEHVGGYGVNLYEGGIYNATAVNAQNITYEALGLSNSFTSGIVTVTSTTGIQFSFSNLGYSL